jgi:hypothetical protein
VGIPGVKWQTAVDLTPDNCWLSPVTSKWELEQVEAAAVNGGPPAATRCWVGVFRETPITSGSDRTGWENVDGTTLPADPITTSNQGLYWFVGEPSVQTPDPADDVATVLSNRLAGSPKDGITAAFQCAIYKCYTEAPLPPALEPDKDDHEYKN